MTGTAATSGRPDIATKARIAVSCRHLLRTLVCRQYPPTPAMARGSASGQRDCETTNNQQRATNSRSSSSHFFPPKLDGALLFRICLLQQRRQQKQQHQHATEGSRQPRAAGNRGQQQAAQARHATHATGTGALAVAACAIDNLICDNISFMLFSKDSDYAIGSFCG